MNYKKILFICVFLAFSYSDNWMHHTNNPWSINMSSRSSSIAGISFENYHYLTENINLSKISMFNSNMFGGLINYNNIFFTHKIKTINILENSIKEIKIGFLSRKINHIASTQDAWDEMLFNEPILSDIDYDLIEYYDHKDFSLLIFVPFSNKYGNFGVNLRPSYSKINQYKADSFSLDFTYSKSSIYYNDNLIPTNLYFGLLFKNLISYKKWSTGYLENFYPSLSALLNYKYSNISIFIEFKDIYLDSNYLNKTFDIAESINLGCEYVIYDKFDLRIGYNNDFYTFGIGAEFYNILFDYAYLHHTDLDYSHQFTLSFLIQNK